MDEINFLSGPGRGVILIKLQKEDDRLLGFIASTGDRDLMNVETTRGAVLVRTAYDTDLAAVERMHHRCSSDTVFRRYFSAVTAISPPLQARLLAPQLAEVDRLVHGKEAEILAV